MIHFFFFFLYCLPRGQASLDCNRWLEGLSLAVVARTEAERETAPKPNDSFLKVKLHTEYLQLLHLILKLTFGKMSLSLTYEFIREIPGNL